jgi:hypothetical protein
MRKRITKTHKTGNRNVNTPNKTWVIFTYHIALVHKVTNLFKHTNIRIAFKTCNIIYNQLQHTLEKKHSTPVAYTDYKAEHVLNLISDNPVNP